MEYQKGAELKWGEGITVRFTCKYILFIDSLVNNYLTRAYLGIIAKIS